MNEIVLHIWKFTCTLKDEIWIIQLYTKEKRDFWNVSAKMQSEVSPRYIFVFAYIFVFPL